CLTCTKVKYPSGCFASSSTIFPQSRSSTPNQPSSNSIPRPDGVTIGSTRRLRKSCGYLFRNRSSSWIRMGPSLLFLFVSLRSTRPDPRSVNLPLGGHPEPPSQAAHAVLAPVELVGQESWPFDRIALQDGQDLGIAPNPSRHD